MLDLLVVLLLLLLLLLLVVVVVVVWLLSLLLLLLLLLLLMLTMERNRQPAETIACLQLQGEQATHLMLLELFLPLAKLLNNWHDKSKSFAGSCASIHCYIFVPAEQWYSGLLHGRGCLETQGIYYFKSGLADTAQLGERPKLSHDSSSSTPDNKQPASALEYGRPESN
jgi:hypothetical protein